MLFVKQSNERRVLIYYPGMGFFSNADKAHACARASSSSGMEEKTKKKLAKTCGRAYTDARTNEPPSLIKYIPNTAATTTTTTKNNLTI